MAKKAKKPFSIKSILMMVIFGVVMFFTIYITPYLLADANSTGWYETGRYAHANLYPGLAIKSYTEALKRFPNPDAFPQGSSIKASKNLLFSLKQGLSGIPFRSIYDFLVNKDFKGLRKLLQSGALSMQKLEVGRLDAAGRARLAVDLRLTRSYIDSILLFQDGQNRSRYSGSYRYFSLAELKKMLILNYARFKKIFIKSDIFIKEDFSRLDALFNIDIKTLETLSTANLSAVKMALRSRLGSMAMYIKRLLNRKHLTFVKQVDIKISGLKKKTEILKVKFKRKL